MKALVIDDDDGIRWLLSRVLREEHFEVVEAGTLSEARQAMQQPFDLIFLDVYLPDGNGMDMLKTENLQAPVVMLTAETTFDHAAEAYQAGAMEYLPKPFDLNEVRQLIHRVQVQPVKAVVTEVSPESGVSSEMAGLILGRSQVMQLLFRTLGRVAASDLTVLVTGESGTGKELVARELHARSPRRHAPFVAINTAAIPGELLEAELFGHEKGAFTGANKTRTGLFEQASDGTLFLDEIGDMPAALQSKLLRVLETGSVQRVGSNEERKVNVRLVAATHQNLANKIQKGEFREDLYYRLNVIPVHIPPLRERRDDIPELAEHLLKEAARELSMSAPILLDDAIGLLKRYNWHGNVRELKNVMRRLAVLTPGASITLSDGALALGQRQDDEQAETLGDTAHRFLKEYIEKLGYAKATGLHKHLLSQVEPALLQLVMEQCQGNQIKASEMLGLNRNTTRKLLRQYDIDPAYFK